MYGGDNNLMTKEPKIPLQEQVSDHGLLLEFDSNNTVCVSWFGRYVMCCNTDSQQKPATKRNIKTGTEFGFGMQLLIA